MSILFLSGLNIAIVDPIPSRSQPCQRNDCGDDDSVVQILKYDIAFNYPGRGFDLMAPFSL